MLNGMTSRHRQFKRTKPKMAPQLTDSTIQSLQDLVILLSWNIMQNFDLSMAAQKCPILSGFPRHWGNFPFSEHRISVSERGILEGLTTAIGQCLLAANSGIWLMPLNHQSLRLLVSHCHSSIKKSYLRRIIPLMGHL